MRPLSDDIAGESLDQLQPRHDVEVGVKYMRMRGQPLLYGRALVRGVRAGNQVQFRTQYLKHCQGGDIYNPTPGFPMQQSGTKSQIMFFVTYC